MELAELLSTRHSVRSYSAVAVTEGDLQAILEAVIRAPSAGNLQAYDIYVAREPHVRDALMRAALHQEFIAQAPLSLVFCAVPARSAVKYRSRGEALYAVQDATIACTYACLAATDQGLASVWVGAFDEDAVRLAIGAPDGHRPVAILPIGTAAEKPRITPRRLLDEVVHEAV